MLLSHHAYSFSSPPPLSLTRLSSSIGMLAASPFRNSTRKAGSTQIPVADDFLVEFDFTELFAGAEDGGAWLGLDADASEILADFPLPEGAEQERAKVVAGREETVSDKLAEDLCGGTMTQELMTTTPDVNSWVPQKEKGRKPSARQEKSSNGKRKMKVDWTPELHRQFLQAVEQLGVDKAVPSKILELMGIRHRLTRHNIASHLQGTISQGIPFFPHQTPVQPYAALQVVGIPQQPIYRPENTVPAARLPIPPPIYLTCWQSQIHHDEQPSKESIDAAIEEVLAHPWLPLSLGLKPPSLESLMMELEKQGIHTVPP